MSATNQHFSNPGCKATNCWSSVDAYSQNGAETLLLTPLRIKAANTSEMHKCDKKHCSITILTRLRHCWHAVVAHYNLLAIQHLLPSIIMSITISAYWASFWQIETWPWGNAVCSNILALFTLIQSKFIYLAKRYIAPTKYPFINRYVQATAHHSPIIYL